MTEIHISDEECGELLVVLNVALYDANEMIRQSHDTDEINAYKEHRATLRKWIHRLSGPRPSIANICTSRGDKAIDEWLERQAEFEEHKRTARLDAYHAGEEG